MGSRGSRVERDERCCSEDVVAVVQERQPGRRSCSDRKVGRPLCWCLEFTLPPTRETNSGAAKGTASSPTNQRSIGLDDWTYYATRIAPRYQNMPSMQYVSMGAGDDTKRRGTMSRDTRRRRDDNSGSSSEDETFDDDEVTRNESTLLLSDREDSMSVDDKSALRGKIDDDDDDAAALADAPSALRLRGGASGLTADPLTSSTVDDTSPKPKMGFRAIRKGWGDDETSDEDECTSNVNIKAYHRDDSLGAVDDSVFLAELNRRRLERDVLLARGNEDARAESEVNVSETALATEKTSARQQSNSASHHHMESQSTDVVGNHEEKLEPPQPPRKERQETQESFNKTQPWEAELMAMSPYQRTGGGHCGRQDRHDRDDLRDQPRAGDDLKPAAQPTRHESARKTRTSDGQRNDRDASRHQPESTNGSFAYRYDDRRENTHQTFGRSGRTNNDYYDDDQYRRRQEHPQLREQNVHRRQESGANDTAPSSLANPYRRDQTGVAPPPNIPKIALEQLKSCKKIRARMSTVGDRQNADEWQVEALRSSLLDLISAFPSNYFEDDQDTSTCDGDGEGDVHIYYATSTEDTEDDSPRSETSQNAASAQLHRKRMFDAAARSLARVAIASRHTKRGDGGSTGRSRNGVGPDFNPPSPRSLPSSMSVLNVHDDEFNFGPWRDSSRTHIFSGRSVHGRNSRTVNLSNVDSEDEGERQSRRRSTLDKPGPFSKWTLEHLAFGTLLLAAQVCYEASCDPRFAVQDSSSSIMPHGPARNSGKSKVKTPTVSSALVESALSLLATAFACLESDFIYSVLKSTLKSSPGSTVTVFDACLIFAPHSQGGKSQDALAMLSQLAVSRGLEATLFVAKYATSLDPSSSCRAYTSPTSGERSTDAQIDSSGVGWISAVGRDLGLRLEEELASPSRIAQLTAIARYAYDTMIQWNPAVIEYGGSRPGVQRANHNVSPKGLYVDTADQTNHRPLSSSIECLQSAILTDRLFANSASFLSSMLQVGIVSTWLDSDNEGTRVERLSQKLFYVLETRSRLSRSTNQDASSSDSEAVCSSSLTLLFVLLEKLGPGQTSPSTAFREMGKQTGTLDDLFQSPMMSSLCELALSWRHNHHEKEATSEIAVGSAIFVLSDVCMVGASDQICSTYKQQLEEFLTNVFEAISRLSQTCLDENCDSRLGPALTFLIQLYSCQSLLVRKSLRKYLDETTRNDSCITSFVTGLLCLMSGVS